MMVAKEQNYKQWYTFQYFSVFLLQIKKITLGNEKAMINNAQNVVSENLSFS